MSKAAVTLNAERNARAIDLAVGQGRRTVTYLLSGIARLFVSIYSTRMRGGYLRFQAQYLRRIRLPRWQDVDTKLKHALVDAAECGDVAACNVAVFKLYRMSKDERVALGGNGE